MYTIKLATPDDAAAIQSVYAPYVRDTCITFEYEVPTVEEFEERIRVVTKEYPWLVCEQEGKIIGYAYGCRHRARAAYDWSVESAIYMANDSRGKGIGKSLYQELFRLLKMQGYVNVFAGMTLPNEKSEGLHKSCGFQEIGVFRNIGYKFNQWHDVKWMQLDINDLENLSSIRTMHEIISGDYL